MANKKNSKLVVAIALFVPMLLIILLGIVIVVVMAQNNANAKPPVDPGTIYPGPPMVEDPNTPTEEEYAYSTIELVNFPGVSLEYPDFFGTAETKTTKRIVQTVENPNTELCVSEAVTFDRADSFYVQYIKGSYECAGLFGGGETTITTVTTRDGVTLDIYSVKNLGGTAYDIFTNQYLEDTGFVIAAKTDESSKDKYVGYIAEMVEKLDALTINYSEVQIDEEEKF